MARGHGVRTERSESIVFYHMTNLETSFLGVLTREVVRFCSRAVQPFPAPLAQMRTALTRDFPQWFSKESAYDLGVLSLPKLFICFTLKSKALKIFNCSVPFVRIVIV